MKNNCFLLVFFLFISIPVSFSQGSWTQTSLSSVTLRPGTASSGTKIFFAGGARGIFLFPSSDVDIYDTDTGQWKKTDLSIGREIPVGVSCGNKVIFAGGVSLLTYAAYDAVDIYNTSTGQWSKSALSQARFSLAGVAYGNQVLFAGGINALAMKIYKTVDVYNADNGTWKIDSLSEARCAMGYAVAGTKAFFAGGLTRENVSDKVDIYDFIAGVWSTARLSQARCFLTAATAGNKVIFAGGMIASDVPSDRVDIYDVISGSWSTANLSKPRAFLNYAASACGKAFFAGGGSLNTTNLNWSSASDVVDIYDSGANSWSVEKLSRPMVNHGVTASGNHLFAGGGSDLHTNLKSVDLYTCIPSGNSILNILQEVRIYPNPASDRIILSLPESGSEVNITFTDLTGKVAKSLRVRSGSRVEIIVNDLPGGIYLLKIETPHLSLTKKLILKGL